MKIDISNSPYYPDFISGYTFAHKKERRTYVVLVRPNGTKSCTAYARYLMSVKLGRKLSRSEQVDHIDEDKTNDSIDNLQVITQKENLAKNHKHRFVAKHGSSSMYKRGCRCDECVRYAKDTRNRWHALHKDDLNRRRRDKRKHRSSAA